MGVETIAHRLQNSSTIALEFIQGRDRIQQLETELDLRIDHAAKVRELGIENRKISLEKEALQREIEVLRAGYEATGLEGSACPGCVYKNGKFIRRCRLHNQINNLEMTAEIAGGK